MTDIPTKVCLICKRSLPYSCYNVGNKNKDGLFSYCKECHSATDVVRKLIYRYNATPAVVYRLIREQNNKCAICGKEETGGMRLALDHNHTTGKVRALLCRNCNKMIGCAKEDISILAKAIEYLKKHNQ